MLFYPQNLFDLTRYSMLVIVVGMSVYHLFGLIFIKKMSASQASKIKPTRSATIDEILRS